MELFLNKIDYKSYCRENKIDKIFNIDIKEYGNLEKKIYRESNQSIDPNNNVPYPVELDDLIRLHFLVRSRKVISVLEFGVGNSTAVFNDALGKNKNDYQDFVTKKLRAFNTFECHSLDNNQKWIDQVKKNFSKLNNVKFHFSECEMSLINSKICCLFKRLPNVSPDLIYIDGPDQHSLTGEVRGINNNNSNLPVVSADILLIEYFLLPGTLIILDGRGANSIFLKNNLQRNWVYKYSEVFDQHFFELQDAPVGKYNKSQIIFSLGKKWLENI